MSRVERLARATYTYFKVVVLAFFVLFATFIAATFSVLFKRRA